MLDFIRIACAVPPVQVGDVKKNTVDICNRIREADEKKCDLVLFPELALTGYTCADLFFQETLLRASLHGLQEIAAFSAAYPRITAVVGLPALIAGQMYNCGAVVSQGKVQGLVPKTFLPNYNEFNESRWFSSARDLQKSEVRATELGLAGGYTIPVGADLIFRIGDGTLVGVEVCEDLWTMLPPSTLMSLAGAEVVLNLSASNEILGKRTRRQELVKHQSLLCSCVYAFCSAGYTESTQDLVFSGHSLIAETGTILGENKNAIDTDYLLIRDCDLGRIRARRRENKSVRNAMSYYMQPEAMRTVECRCRPLRGDGSCYALEKLPFVPSSEQDRLEQCRAIFQSQVAGLKQRLKAVGANAVIGVSGGLDSTLALLVAVEAMHQLGRPADQVFGVTMPCFGTSNRTYQNAWKLMRILGIHAKEISIGDAVTGHFRDIGHDINVRNVTYENAQARERTQVLMDYASVVGGIVVGTGDLSELALGWCTYNGDHMSMYGVNASVPKTLMRWIIQAVAEMPQYQPAKAVLMDILDTPISPELLPTDGQGKIAQQTEDLVGPYELHDFFLYYMLRFGFRPEKIYRLACRAFAGEYDGETVKKWLKVFYKRFFTQQFKRSCMPDGAKVGPVSLSPRGDWRMPSDISGRLWLEEVEKL